MRNCINRSTLFAHPPLKQALARRGFDLNHGAFTAAESLKLMTNFEDFLKKRGISADHSSIADLLKDNFCRFYLKTKLFRHIGDGLNRASDQLYTRLRTIYHNCKRNKISAAEDGFILEQTAKLEAQGYHRKFKSVGEDLDRFCEQVKNRHHTLTKSDVPLSDEEILKMIANDQGCDVASIDVNRDIAFQSFDDRAGCSAESLARYWIKKGKSKYLRSKLPRWTLENSLLLLDKIQEGGEEDENCVDFETIYEKSFCGHVEDFKHLRDHYNRIRRVVPYYMLDDLQSIVAVAKKALKERMCERKSADQVEEGDEDLFSLETP